MHSLHLITPLHRIRPGAFLSLSSKSIKARCKRWLWRHLGEKINGVEEEIRVLRKMTGSKGKCKRIRGAPKLESDRLAEASYSSKRRKFCCDCSEIPSSRSSLSSSSSAINSQGAVSFASGHCETVTDSRCSVADSTSSFQFDSLLSDLKVIVEENSIFDSEIRTKTTRCESIQGCGNPERVMESPYSASSSCRRLKPSPSEIDDFFAGAEKREQKRFADKYNYDIMRDVPLEGRYEWVRFKQ